MQTKVREEVCFTYCFSEAIRIMINAIVRVTVVRYSYRDQL
jgi:hypothetical protein